VTRSERVLVLKQWCALIENRTNIPNGLVDLSDKKLVGLNLLTPRQFGDGSGIKVTACFLIAVLFLFGCASTAAAQFTGSFMPTAGLTKINGPHIATLLFNGKVLIVGRNTAELFDPRSETFTEIGGLITAGKLFHTATLLTDGRVLIIGYGPVGEPVQAELYDSSNGTFTKTGGTVTPAISLTGTLLNDGRVLLTGSGLEWCPPSYNEGCMVAQPAEIYDPVTGTFTTAGDYADKIGDPFFGTVGLVFAPTTLLPDGEVLIAATPVAELYNPDSGTFRLAGQTVREPYEEFYLCGPPGSTFTCRHPGYYFVGGRGTLLANGQVLLTGGEEHFGAVDGAELYDPITQTFKAIPDMNTARYGHSATLLRDGTVLLAGGFHVAVASCPPPRCALTTNGSAELYDPSTNRFVAIGGPNSVPPSHSATLLMDGRVLIISDSDGTAELYTPTSPVPAQVINDLRFDRTSVVAGSTYSAVISGSNLDADTFFDVRFRSPVSDRDRVVLNWQVGLTQNHGVLVDTPIGSWKISGVRAHQVEEDHTGMFFPVSATLSVMR
jgi:Galactose oxidase, central domain